MADVFDYTPTVDISDVNDEVWFDIINRTITPKNPDAIEDVLVQNDANSRNFGFMIQRYFEEEDLSTKQIRVHYVNSLNMHDIAEAHSMEIVGNEQDVLSFKWLVGNKACVEAGAMKFAVEFYDNTGYELYTKAITVNITEGIYIAGEIPNPDDWYVTFKRELNELSDMYDEAMEKVQGKLDTENFVGVLSDGTEELNGVYGNHCVGMVESGMTNPYIYENWYDSTHDINTQYRIYVPWNGATNGERQMRQRVYNSKTNLHEWSEWKTVDYSCQIDNASFTSLSSFQSYNFKENHIYKFYASQEVSELLGYDSPQYWLGVYWFDASDVPTLPEHYMYLTNLYDGKRGKLNLDTFEYTEYNKSSVGNTVVSAGVFTEWDNIRAYEFKTNVLYRFAFAGEITDDISLTENYCLGVFSIEGGSRWLNFINFLSGKCGELDVDNGKYIEYSANGSTAGENGKSAYEIALDNGFKGTEAEWLESLKGSSGVYVGSGEMPEDCNVQIDPDGEVIDLSKYATTEYVNKVISAYDNSLLEVLGGDEVVS